MSSGIIGTCKDIIITYQKYSVKLESNSFLKDTMGEITIPEDDIQKYGYPVSAQFYNYSSAPGAVCRHNSDPYSFNCRSLSNEGSGFIQIIFLKLI